MNFGDIRGYFRTKLDALNYREWEDGFNFENIPSTILDGSYHIEVGSITGGPANQVHHTFLMPITVRIFFKGYRTPGEAIDAALNEANLILDEILKPSNRLQTNGLKDVRPVSIQPVALQLSNDNAVILTMGFEAYLIYCFSN
jgi:hypothetical protein